MDYIYKDIKENKKVGEITDLVITPYYEFEVKLETRYLSCSLNHITNEYEWTLFIDEYEGEGFVKLADPTDTFWNSEAIDEIVENIDESIQIAYAIKEIYTKYHYEDVIK